MRKIKNPPWLAAAGNISARDNEQTRKGSQWKSAVPLARSEIALARLLNRPSYGVFGRNYLCCLGHDCVA